MFLAVRRETHENFLVRNVITPAAKVAGKLTYLLQLNHFTKIKTNV